MGNASLRNITNSFQDVQLASLASRKQAGEPHILHEIQS